MISKPNGIKINNSGSAPVQASKKDYSHEPNLTQIFSFLKKDFVWSSSFVDQSNYCSESIVSVIGYTFDEIKSFNEKRLALASKEDVGRIREALNEFLVDPATNFIKLVYKIEIKNHNLITVLEKIYALRDENGDVINLYGIVTDISEIKEAEDRLFNTITELQKVNEAKDRFVSRISHDLRAPFTSIIGFAEVLLTDSQIPEKDKIDYLNYIHQSSKNMLHFVTQLSEIIKLQTFRMKLEPQRVNLNKLVHYSIASFTSHVVDKNLELKVNIDNSLNVTADERLFLLLISCLISNAVKFSKIGGRIFVSAQEFNDSLIEVVIKDEGVGISEKNKTKLFKIDQIFFSEGTKGEKGVGLGLLLSKEIIEKHGGNLWFYSSQNEGSEFHFTLPVSKNAILIIEKDNSSRTLYAETVKNICPQYDVVCAKDGYEALTTINERFPTIIILNHELPLMTGVQFLDSILKLNKQAKISVLLIAENLSEDTIKSYERFGTTEILHHPISVKVLERKLRELVNSHH